MKAELIINLSDTKCRTNRGSGLIEIIIALAVLTLSIGAVIMLVFANQNLKIDVFTNNEAVSKGQELTEALRAKSRQDFSAVATISPTTDGIYTKSAVVTDIDAFTKLITTTVTWNESAVRPLIVKFMTLVTDPLSALGGDTCNQALSGDWTRPQDWKGGYGYADIVSPNGASGVDAFNKKVYLTSDVDNKPAFYIIDASNPMPAGLNLPILGSLPSQGYGFTDVRVSGKYAYVAVHSTSVSEPQLLVVDISNSASPTIVTQLRMSGGTSATYASTIAYYRQKIYLGLTKNTGREVRVVDVANPAVPVEVGTGFETNTKVNQIVAKDDMIYIASALNNQAWVVDISNPLNPVQSNPIQQTFVDPSGTQEWSGQSVAFSENKVYLGRIRDIGNNALEDLYILNANDLSAAPLGTMTQTKNDGVTRMVVRSNLIFMSNAAPNDGFQIWNAVNPGSLIRYDTTPINIQQTSTAGMDCDGNFIYIGQKSNRALQIIGPYDPGVFNYALSTPADVTLVRAGASQNTSFAATISGGTTQPVNFTNSALPSGVTMNYSATSCSPTCTTNLTLSASAGAALGTNTITINGDSPAKSTAFNVTVNAPAFAYSFANISNITLLRGGAAVPITVTATMAAGAVPQTVTITAPDPGVNPADIVVTPSAVQSCTPNAASPYTCAVTFNYSASAAAATGNYNNQRVNGSPNGVQSNAFRIRVQ